jgi:hypothetical protein
MNHFAAFLYLVVSQSWMNVEVRNGVVPSLKREAMLDCHELYETYMYYANLD